MNLSFKREVLAGIQGRVGKKKDYTILLVDDEPSNLESLAMLLDEYHILTANDGEEALSVIQATIHSFSIDLIITDQRMPKMMGTEFLERSIPILPDAKRIILTGYTDISDMITAINKGQIYYFMVKPFNIEEMKLLVQRSMDLHEAEKKLEQSFDMFKKFVPRQFLEMLNKDSLIDIQLGDQVQKEMTILFGDIRSFTNLCEDLTPAETFEFINTYLNKVSPAVRKHNGFIDKYIGDGIMALFPESADDALHSAIEMLRQVSQLNRERLSRSLEPLRIGIGLHSGLLILGIVGEEERLSGTVISDSVNLASRIEQLTKFYGASILISEETFSRLTHAEAYHFRILDHARVKGKKDLVLVVQIFDGEPEEKIRQYMLTKSVFEKGVINYFTENFSVALDCFQQVAKQNPDDISALMYVKRCESAIRLGYEEVKESVVEHSSDLVNIQVNL
jgi:two-component system, sensor histidine kinase ChiS